MQKYLIILLATLLFVSCENNRWASDISSVEIEQEFKRLDRDLFNIPHDSVWEYVPILQEKYGYFFELYNVNVISIGSTHQLDYNNKLTYFLTDPDIIGVHEMVENTFSNLSFENEVRDAFKHYHHFFPDKDIPDVYTHISGFNQSVIVDSGYMSISLDKYLGKNTKYYQMLRTPMYQRTNMHPQKISADLLFALAVTEFEYLPETDNLISQMVHYGKIHHFLDAVLPETQDSLKWGYSTNKLDWCKNNERKIWMYLVENKLVFNSSFKEVKRYIDEGPFTSTLSKQSPGKIGRWIGYKIVESYLDEHPEVTLAELMQNNNYQRILSESKYRP